MSLLNPSRFSLLCGLAIVATACSNPSSPSSTSTTTGKSSGLTVTTLAGSYAGFLNGPGATATFDGVVGVAVDGSDNVYVADQSNDAIRKIDSSGNVTTFAGTGSTGAANGPAASATFKLPEGVAVDASGNVYVGDTFNNLIRMIASNGTVSTLAGSGASGAANGTGTSASFSSPAGVAVDASGNVYVADHGNNLIRKITPSGVVTTLAGSGSSGAANGTGTAASFSGPFGVSVDSSGNVYVADTGNNLIRLITPTGVVSTLAGSGATGSANGTGAVASFSSPQGVSVDSSGNVYVGDTYNNQIRKITPAGVVTAYAGVASSTTGYTDGPAATATFADPMGVAVSSTGTVYTADSGSNKVRKIQ